MQYQKPLVTFYLENLKTHLRGVRERGGGGERSLIRPAQRRAVARR